MKEKTDLSLDEILKIAGRRKWSILLPMMSIVVVSCIAAFSLPSIYRSSATILVEEQEIPKEFVTGTITSYTEQRIQSINKRVTSFSMLLEIIEQLNLYPEMKESHTNESIIKKMTDDISLVPLSTEVLDHRTGRSLNSTIAFELAYVGEDPIIVQHVAEVLAKLFLEENRKERVQQVEDTSNFLEGEIDKIEKELSKIESKIAVFKQKHMNELPEMLQMNLQMMNTIERDLERANQQMRGLSEREIYLLTQLDLMEPFLESEEELTTRRRLEGLKIELVALTKQFSHEYPDVVNVKSEIKELEAKLGLMERPKNNSPDNPTYITLSAQHASVLSEIMALEGQINELRGLAEKYRRRIMATPNVEDKYNDLMTAKKSTQAKFDDLTAKLMEARVAHGLEKEQKGDRFVLLEPPRLPNKPYKPNRIAIILMGIFLGVGAGLGTAALREYFDDRIYDAETLVHNTKIPVLAGIPVIRTYTDSIIKRKRRIAYIGLIVLVAVLGLVIVHFTGIYLDNIWIAISSRL